MYEPIRPSLVERPDFFAACASPRLRRIGRGLLEVAVGLLKRGLALHHARAGTSRSVLTREAEISTAIRTPRGTSQKFEVRSLKFRVHAVTLQLRTSDFELLTCRMMRLDRGRRRFRARLGVRGGSVACASAMPRPARTASAMPAANSRIERSASSLPGNDVVDLVGVAVGVDDADHRNLELARFVDGDLLELGVDDEDGVGQARSCRECRRGSSPACGAPFRGARFPSSTASRSGRRSSSPRARAGGRDSAESSRSWSGGRRASAGSRSTCRSAVASSAIASCACRLVPTKRTVPPWPAVDVTNSAASR